MNLHSLLVAQAHTLRTESYWFPYQPDMLHDVRSVAKSITSLLVGVALDQQRIASLDQPIIDFFPARTFPDPRQSRITIKHLLTMTSGIALSDSDTGRLFQSQDWIEFVLGAPMAAEPGEVFNYSTSSYYLLSAILHACEVSESALFAPLEITNYRWQTDPAGIRMGGFGLWLLPRDMLKIGQLVLDAGRWNGEQIVSSAWITASTTPAVHNYAYGWWLEPGLIRAAGYGGQDIFVIPDQQIVAVFTAGHPGEVNLALVQQHILPDLPLALPPAPAPAPQPVPPLPDAARRISGQRYLLDTNSLEWADFTLRFDVSAAALDLRCRDDRVTLTLGLDDVLRVNPVDHLGPLSDHDPIALKAAWEDDHTLLLHLHIVNNPENLLFHLAFTADAVTVRFDDPLTAYTETFQGHLSE